MIQEQFKDTIEKIREGLPHGAMTKIAESSGFSIGYISRFFDGDYMVTKENKDILLAAQAILREEKSALDEINKSLKSK